MRLRACTKHVNRFRPLRNPSTQNLHPSRSRRLPLVPPQSDVQAQRRHLSATPCSKSDADQDGASSNDGSPEALEDQQADVRSDGRGQTEKLVQRLMEARLARQARDKGQEHAVKNIQEQSNYKAYSIPEPDMYRGSSTNDIRRSRRGQSFDHLQLPEFYASRATPPLLLTFDAFDTLYAPRAPVAQQYCDVAAQYGYTAQVADIEASFRKEFKEMLLAHPQYGKTTRLSVESWWKRLIIRVFASALPEPTTLDPGFLSTLYIRFATSEGYDLFSDVPPLLQRIGTSFSASSWSPKRTMVGIVSNSDPRARSVLRTLGVVAQPGLFPPRLAPVHPRDNPSFGPASVSFEALSYELDVDKPDPRIFDHALRLAQKALSQHAPVARTTRSGKQMLSSIRDDFWHCHVGDSLEKDILPALEAGWDAILLDRQADEPVTIRVAGTQEYTVINSLDALAGVLTPERAKDAMTRGRRIRKERQDSGQGHALDFKDTIDEHGTLGFKASENRTLESMKYLGSGPVANEYREERRQLRRAALERRRRSDSV